MGSKGDARFEFLRDEDLYDLVLRVVFKIVRDEVDAEDVRQGAYVLAMKLVLDGRGPLPGFERGWLCRVAKNHARKAFTKKLGREAPADDPEELDIPVEDQQTLFAEQQRLERMFDAAAEMAARHPEKAAQLLAPDGRLVESGAADAAKRKRRERARALFAAAIAAAAAAAIVFLLMRRTLPPVPGPPRPVWNDVTLAAATRELAARSCAADDARACLAHLEDAERLDPGRFGPAERSARTAAVGRLRAGALEACGAQKWTDCLAGLDEARKYDPEGDREPLVQLARSEAQTGLTKAFSAPFLDSKGPLPP